MERFYRFLSDTTFESLDDSVIEQAKRVVLDTLGVIIAASAEPEPTGLAASVIQMNPPGTATVWRNGFPGLAPPQAAFLNGATGPVLELDEGHRYFSTHGAIHVLPACLALGEHLHSSGSELLAALVVGYDAAARIGGACCKNPKLHPHGTWATVGAAVACAHLKRFDKEAMGRLVNLAAGLTLATSSRTTLEGATVRNATPGIAAQTGVLAVLLAENNYLGLADGLQETFGNISASVFSVDRLVDAIGERYEITRNFFKLHACCQFNHVTLDALNDLLREPSFDSAEIEQIDVYTFDPAVRMKNPAPSNMLAAKFSLPYAIGARLVYGHAGIGAFRLDTPESERIRAIAERVILHDDPAFTRNYPYQRSARIVVRTSDGATAEAFRQAAHGYEERLSISQLEEKFFELTAPVIGSAAADKLRERIQRLERLPDVNTLPETL